MKKIPDFASDNGTPAKKAKQARAGQVKAKAATAVIAATMLALPMLLAPQSAAAQATVGPPISPTKPTVPPVSVSYSKVQADYRPIKMSGTYAVLGEGDGHTVFKGQDGSMFFLDPNTGDKRSVAVDMFLKIGDIKGSGSGSVFKFWLPSVSIVGRDAKGNTVMKNARNETFILDPSNGNMVFIPRSK